MGQYFHLPCPACLPYTMDALGYMHPGVTQLLCVARLGFLPAFNRSLEFVCTFILSQDIWYMLINTEIL